MISINLQKYFTSKRSANISTLNDHQLFFTNNWTGNTNASASLGRYFQKAFHQPTFKRNSYNAIYNNTEKVKHTAVGWSHCTFSAVCYLQSVQVQNALCNIQCAKCNLLSSWLGCKVLQCMAIRNTSSAMCEKDQSAICALHSAQWPMLKMQSVQV